MSILKKIFGRTDKAKPNNGEIPVAVVKRGDLQVLADSLAVMAGVERSGNESPEMVRRFKYAMGRNYKVVRELAEETKELCAAINESNLMQEYTFKREDAVREFSEHNPDGTLKTKLDPATDKQIADVTKENMKHLRAKWASLEKEYVPRLDKIMDNILVYEITVPLWRWNFNNLPEKISGAYIAAIAILLDDVPAEIKSQPLSTEILPDSEDENVMKMPGPEAAR